MTKTTKKPASKAGAIKADKEQHLKLEEQARMLKEQMSFGAASVVAYQQTSGDDGDMSQQSEQAWLFLSQNKANAKELELIQRALQRIQEGTYGVCSNYAQPISPRRLRAIPWAECCIECQDGGRQPLGLTG